MRPIFAGMICVLCGFFFLSSAASYAHESGIGTPKRIFTKHFKKTLFDITEKADYSIEVLPDDTEYPIGRDVVGIVVHNAYDEDVVGAEIAIDYRNLDTGEVIGPLPVISDKGNGLYTVSPLDLTKEGKRTLSVKIRKGAVTDSVQFTLPEAMKNLFPPGRYSP